MVGKTINYHLTFDEGIGEFQFNMISQKNQLIEHVNCLCFLRILIEQKKSYQ